MSAVAQISLGQSPGVEVEFLAVPSFDAIPVTSSAGTRRMDMALWLVRAGSHGEFEKKFIEDGLVFATWEDLDVDFRTLATKEQFRQALEDTYPDAPKGRITNHLGQLWAFGHEMLVGDWVAMPLKKKAVIAFGEIKSEYKYFPGAKDPFYHGRKVKWLSSEVPRSVFDQDLLYSFGAFMTICKIQRNDAENRVRAIAANGWKSTGTLVLDEGVVDGEGVDLERLAMDQIAKLIIAKFKGHGMERLVEAILQAQGYTTFRTEKGPDKGIDILAASGPQGFGSPRICVQVKSSDTPVDHPTLQQLVGSMQSVGADFGLLVSWGGFKSSVDKVYAQHFFKVRLWDQDALIEELLRQYDKLEEDIRTELPLKRIWTLASPDETD